MKKAIALLSIIFVLLLPSIAMAAPADSTGLTAKIVATKNQVITGNINAAGYDIGVYVGAGVTGVIIKNAVITGANDHGIFVQDTSNVIVINSRVTGIGTPLNHAASMPEDKAITLSGTSGVIIQNNFVGNNLVDGGIAITDDGAFSPGALNPGSPHSGHGNIIIGNTIENNIGGCGIVIAAYNPGQGVADNIVTGNTVIGNSPGPSAPPFIGGIVVAADAPFTTAKNNLVIGNAVNGGWIPGIIVHSNAPGDVVTGTLLIGNKLDSNGAFPPTDPNDAQKSTGINIVAEASPGEPNAPVLTNTLVIGNTVHNDYYGVWKNFDTGTLIIGLLGNAIVPIAP